MKAVVYRKYGPPDVLRVEDVDKPVPKDNELLIRVHAAEVTKADCELRSFRFPVKWFWLPLRLALGPFRPRKTILGGYFAGQIEAVGKDVTRFSAGDQVFGVCGIRFGAYGEYVCLPDSCTIVTKPANMSFDEAAAVPLGGLNALHFMRRAKIRRGERVLINGAGGSIGIFAVQIAKSMGAEVTAVDSAIKRDMLNRIGADHFFDYADGHFSQDGNGYDVIFDMVARKSYGRCIAALNPGGRYLIGNPRLSDMVRALLTSRFSDKTVIFQFAGETEEELLALKQMITDGRLTSTVDRTYLMAQAAEAHRRVEREERLGTIVMSMFAEPGG
ncbi:MAG: NAD(P)-dependent alcohol dehydrogenase [Paracoccaceae bacterium]